MRLISIDLWKQIAPKSNYSVNIETQLNDGTVIDSGTSTTFSVIHNTLALFKFDPILSQVAGSLFGVSITAKDQYNNTVTAFTDTAVLSDLTGGTSRASRISEEGACIFEYLYYSFIEALVPYFISGRYNLKDYAQINLFTPEHCISYPHIFSTAIGTATNKNRV